MTNVSRHTPFKGRSLFKCNSYSYSFIEDSSTWWVLWILYKGDYRQLHIHYRNSHGHNTYIGTVGTSVIDVHPWHAGIPRDFAPQWCQPEGNFTHVRLYMRRFSAWLTGDTYLATVLPQWQLLQLLTRIMYLAAPLKIAIIVLISQPGPDISHDAIAFP